MVQAGCLRLPGQEDCSTKESRCLPLNPIEATLTKVCSLPLGYGSRETRVELFLAYVGIPLFTDWAQGFLLIFLNFCRLNDRLGCVCF